AKDATRELLEGAGRAEGAREDAALVTDGALSVYSEGRARDALDGSNVAGVLRSHLARARVPDYVALLDYFAETPEHDAALARLRERLREVTGCAVTSGYGPRYLHSTGQLHKGGPDTGVFLQLTAPDREDSEVPGEAYTFGSLKRAQALGDFRALAARGRRVLRVDLGADALKGLEQLLAAVGEALARTEATGV
ncbi:MAG TPA: hypothetical protein VER32_04675, partial [Pyrinomonadaceae bacterium]|nr:hypothetical protein [Pyrinomonadaceae bacterium]